MIFSAQTTMASWSELALTDLPATLVHTPWAVVEFWAPDCLFSRLLAPARAVLAKRYDERLLLRRCMVQGGEQACVDMGVTALPALVLFQKGQRVHRWIGEIHASLVTRVIDVRLAETAMTLTGT